MAPFLSGLERIGERPVVLLPKGRLCLLLITVIYNILDSVAAKIAVPICCATGAVWLCDTRSHEMSEAKAFRLVSDACPQSLSASLVMVGWKARGNVQGSFQLQEATGLGENRTGERK